MMNSFAISKNDAGQRLDKFISKAVPNLPKSLMYKYIRTKRIKVNSKRADISTRLEENDIVDMYINDEFFAKKEHRYDFSNASKNIDIIYEDENIILADKKAGLLCHPDDKEYNAIFTKKANMTRTAKIRSHRRLLTALTATRAEL